MRATRRARAGWHGGGYLPLLWPLLLSCQGPNRLFSVFTRRHELEGMMRRQRMHDELRAMQVGCRTPTYCANSCASRCVHCKLGNALPVVQRVCNVLPAAHHVPGLVCCHSLCAARQAGCD